MKRLEGLVALVAGGSRGAGRGIARALGDGGATVYVAARTSRAGPKPADSAPGTIEETAEEVTARGGRGIPVLADLGSEEQVRDLFARVAKEQGRLDVLTNSAWTADVMSEFTVPFWELSSRLWQDTARTMAGCWLTGVYATRAMKENRRGLIAYVTDNHALFDYSPSAAPAPPPGYRGQILHDLGHEFMNRLVADMALETAKLNLTVVGLNPGFMRTERVRMSMTTDEIKRQFRYDLSESPEYVGRAVAALAADPAVFARNGSLLSVCDLAEEYGFTDIDGRRIPRFDPSAPLQPFPED